MSKTAPKKQESILVKGLITGPMVIAEMLSGGLFLENLKMEKQRTAKFGNPERYGTLARGVLNQGIKGFWAGFWPWGFIYGMSKGVVLGGARSGFTNLFHLTGMEEKNVVLAAGFAAGGAQGVVMSPLLLGRTRVNEYLRQRIEAGDKSMLNTTLRQEMALSARIVNEDIAKYGFFRTITKGMPVMVFKRTIDWGTRFMFMGMVKRRYLEYKASQGDLDGLTKLERLVCTFVGGSMSLTICMPLDAIMPIIQSAGSSQESLATVLQKKFSGGGLATFQAGLVVRAIHVGWHTTFAIFLADEFENYARKHI